MASEPLKPGYRLHNRYRITRRRAISGLGAVYQAHDLQAEPPAQPLCAIKETLVNEPDPAARRRALADFTRKAAQIARLSHPAIPPVRDYFTEDNRTYLVTEFVKGRDLEHVLSETDMLAIPVIHRWGLELCDVLDYLHTLPTPIIYRDLKPSNVMIDPHSRAHLIDFDIAVTLDSRLNYSPLGTDGYAAPEQYRGEVSPVIDIYALGATLHHLLTRRDPRLEPPFTFARRPVRAINPAVPEAFAAIVMRAVENEPWRRFRTIGEMKQALEQITWE
jgi:serine/threonine protein kinase